MGSELLRFFICVLACALIADAQQSNAELSGTITDVSGGLVLQAQVTALQEATGLQRTTHTNNAGLYVFTQLPPGSYKVTIAKSGFQTEVRSGVVLTVGQQQRIDVNLKLGQISTETVVRSEAALVETQSAALSAVMEQRSMQELPLNGRDVSQLALLEPGVAPARRSNDVQGFGQHLSIAGRRPDQVSFILDGMDINDGSNGTPGSVAGVLLGVDTLQEFRVLTNGYSAEYGRSAGGVIDAVTRSGGNALQGSLFEFVRNSSFDAKNYFDAHNQPIPPFKRNQFGGIVSGPIIHDKTFFLFSYEGLRQRLGLTNTAVVPDAAARQGIVHGQPAITINPAVSGYLNLFPLPNGSEFGDGTGRFTSQAANPTNENFFTVRVDHHFSEKTSLFGRYWYDAADESTPDNLLLTSANTESRNQYATLQLTRAINDHMLDSARLGYNRSHSAQAASDLRAISPDLSFFPGLPLGQISITGLASLGPSRFSPSFLTQNLFEGSNDFSWVAGRHSLQFGIDAVSILLPTSQPQSLYGYYQFNSLAEFLKAHPYAVELTLPGSKANRNWQQSLASIYVQDDFHAARNFTVNAGLRYEYATVPSERDGLTAALVNPATDQAPTPGPLYKNPSALNLAPRFGFAWDPFGDGKTSVRSGFGIYFDPLWTDFYSNTGNRMPPYYTIGSVSNPVFPNAAAIANSPNFVLGRLDAIQYRPASPYSMQYNFSIQREIAKGNTLTVAYIGQRGVHDVRLIDENQAVPQILSDGRYYFPANSTVRNPNFTGIRYKVTDGQSDYNGLQISYTARFHRFFSLRSSYTWSKNIDDGDIVLTQGGTNDLPQNPNNRKAERGLSDYDLRNYFVTYLTGDIPKFSGPRWLSAGWQINVISTLASGNPFSAAIGYDRARSRPEAGTAPQRPDLVPGYSANPILGSPNQYFDPRAFSLPATGFYGNLGRNTLVGPGLVNVDISVNKVFQLTERASLQFRTEMFNALNHPNFSIPSQRTVFSSTGPVNSAGLITSTLTSSRQLQLGLKLSF